MRYHQSTQYRTSRQATVSLEPLVNFVFSIEYKGEKCFECGHPWTEKGNLHFKHCSFYVSPHSADTKKH